jgi:hypothetical protein
MLVLLVIHTVSRQKPIYRYPHFFNMLKPVLSVLDCTMFFFVMCHYFLYILACVDFKASNSVVSGHEYWLPCGGGIVWRDK